MAAAIEWWDRTGTTEGWLLQFVRGDLPSWIAVAIAVLALIGMVYAIFRRQGVHSELNLTRLHFDDDGGPISLEANFTTYSHASRLVAQAKLKLDGVNYPMTLDPVNIPTNAQYTAVNTFPLKFTGEYTKLTTLPKTATPKNGPGSRRRQSPEARSSLTPPAFSS